MKTLFERMTDMGRGFDPRWQPIGSAPKDGSIVLLTSTSPQWKYPFPAKWSVEEGRWVFADEPLNDIWGVSDLVSHWMPLPAPPEPQS